MKKNIFIKSFLVALSFIAFSCSTDENKKTYSGESQLHFITEAATVPIESGSPDVIYEVPYSTITPVSVDTQVNLVLDAANSTAIEGVDFEVAPVNIAKGEATGVFQVIFYGTASQSKVAVFNLESTDIGNAVFKQALSLTTLITCPIPATSFIGNYTINQVTAINPADRVPVFSTGTVTLTYVSPTQRRFSAKYLAGLNLGNYPSSVVPVNLLCGSTVLSSGIGGVLGCTSQITLGPGTNPGAYNVNDDRSLTITMTEYVTDGGCGAAPYQVTFTLTKI